MHSKHTHTHTHIYIYIYLYLYLYCGRKGSFFVFFLPQYIDRSTPVYWALFYESQNFTLYIYIYICIYIYIYHPFSKTLQVWKYTLNTYTFYFPIEKGHILTRKNKDIYIYIYLITIFNVTTFLKTGVYTYTYIYTFIYIIYIYISERIKEDTSILCYSEFCA